MNMARAECEAVMHERGVYRLLRALGHIQQVREVAEVPKTPTDAVAGAILVENKHLPRGEPTLGITGV